MDDDRWLTDRFAEHRDHLHAVAYRMLGSASEADDAVQDAWIRVSRADATVVENMGGWLTTITARVCLNRLRSRQSRREESLDVDVRVPDPVVTSLDTDPAAEAELADSVGLALLVVLETLTPAERLSFVLHDMFAVPFDEIGPMVDRTPEAARQLASRARRRVQGAAVPDRDVHGQRAVVEAFFAAARDGDFDALVAVLDPDVVLRSDGGTALPPASALVRGAATVAGRALMFSNPDAVLHPVLVNGVAGVVVTIAGTPTAVMAFTVVDGTIATIDVLADPTRLATLPTLSNWRQQTGL